MFKILFFVLVIWFTSNIEVDFLWAQESALGAGKEPREETALKAGSFLRDPFIVMINEKQLSYPEQAGLSLEQALFPMELKGIMVRDGKSVAIINQEIVSEGQIWHNLKVERIDKEGVTLNYDGKSTRLAMKDNQKNKETPAPQNR